MAGEHQDLAGGAALGGGGAASGQSPNKKATGKRPRPSRKPIDEKTGEPAKRYDFSIGVGRRLREARIGNGTESSPDHEINDVARHFGWNRQTINTYENGYAVPPAEKLVMLCDFYHVGLDYILRGKDAEVSVIEQALEALPHHLRKPVRALYERQELSDSVVALAALPDELRRVAVETLAHFPNLNESNLEVIRNLAAQLAQANNRI